MSVFFQLNLQHNGMQAVFLSKPWDKPRTPVGSRAGTSVSPWLLQSTEPPVHMLLPGQGTPSSRHNRGCFCSCMAQAVAKCHPWCCRPPSPLLPWMVCPWREKGILTRIHGYRNSHTLPEKRRKELRFASATTWGGTSHQPNPRAEGGWCGGRGSAMKMMCGTTSPRFWAVLEERGDRKKSQEVREEAEEGEWGPWCLDQRGPVIQRLSRKEWAVKRSLYFTPSMKKQKSTSECNVYCTVI